MTDVNKWQRTDVRAYARWVQFNKGNVLWKCSCLLLGG